MSPQHKAKTHKAAGIRRKPSEAVYSADILSDKSYTLCSDIGRGLWCQTLLYIWHDNTDRLSGSLTDLVALWNTTPERARKGIFELITRAPCDVYLNGKKVSRDVTECPIESHDIVTLVNRRQQRALKDRKLARDRKRAQRDRKASQNVTDDVTPPGTTPSSSSSFSVSERSTSLSTNERKRIFDFPLELLRASQHFAGLTAAQYEAAIGGRHYLSDFAAAAKQAIKAAELDGDIKKPAVFLAACVDRYTREHATDLSAAIGRRKEREKDFDDLVGFIIDMESETGPRAAEKLTRAKADFARKHGAEFVERAETEARERGKE